MPPSPKPPVSSADANEAAQKRFYMTAGGGLLLVLVLAFFAFRPASDEAPAPSLPAASPDASAAQGETAAAAPAPAAPSVPGVSGGGGGSRGVSGGQGRPGGGTATTPAARGAAAPTAGAFTAERGRALGLSARAISALSDSAASRNGGSAPPPTNGRASVGRATTLMSAPGSGTALVTVPSGTPLTLSGCQPAPSGATWCRASHAGFSGWVSQSDVSG